MFRFFKKSLQGKHCTENKTIIDLLNNPQTKQRDKMINALTNFGRLKNDKHGNSLLLYALAWNHTEAALWLAIKTIIENKELIKLHDSFSSSKSSPLILASKTGNNKIANELIYHSEINATDYLGNTALHYACLMRNNKLVKELLRYDVDISKQNKNGYRPLDYYNQTANETQLAYLHGTVKSYPNLMVNACDWNRSYQGTTNPHFNNYRWFLPHIISNLELANDLMVDGISNNQIFIFQDTHRSKSIRLKDTKLKTIINFHLSNRIPVVDHRVYQVMTRVYLAYRKKQYDEAIASKLDANVDVELKEISTK